MLFSCPRCTGAHLASRNRNLGALPKMVDFLPANMVGTRKIHGFLRKLLKTEHSPANCTIFAVLLVFSISTSPTENCCLVCCYQILLIKGAIYIRPRVHLGVPTPFRRLRWQETRKINGFLGKLLENGAYWQIARFSRFCGFPAISTSPTKNWCLVFCYQILLIKCAIHIKHAEGKRKLM